MRSLVLMEFYTSSDLSGVSMVNTTMDLFRALDTDGRRHYAQMVVPPRGGTYTWPDGFFAHEWCSSIEVGDEYPLNSDSPPISARLGKMINPGRGRIVYDYVLCEKFFHASTLAMQLWTMPSKWKQVFRVPIVNWFWESTLDRRLPLHGTDAALSLLAAGTWVSETMVMNDYDLVEFERQMSRFLSAERLGEVMKRTHVLRAGFDMGAVRAEHIEKQRKARRETDPTVVLMHGGSFERKRRLPFAAQTVSKLISDDVPIRFLLTTQHGAGNHAGAKPLLDHGAEVWTDIRRSDWLDMLWRGDLIYCGAEYEGTGLAYMEGIVSGMLPVGMAETWIASRLPDDYPLLGEQKELPDLLRLAVERYDELKAEWHDRLVASLLPWDSIQVARSYDEVIRGLVDEVTEENLHTARTVQPAFGILEKATDKLDEIDDVEDVYEMLTAHSDKGAEFRYVTPLALNWMLKALGFTDVADRAGLHLKR